MVNTNKELSIQITLGGFSFQINSYARQLSGELSSYEFDSVLAEHYDLTCGIEWSVTSVLIIPFDVFDHSCIDHYLISAGMMREGLDRSMFAVRGEYVAVWAVEESLVDYLETRIPNAEHTHSLLSLLAQYNHLRNAIVIDIDKTDLMHIAVWRHDGLETALSTPVSSATDVLFFCRRLSKSDEMISYNVVFHGGVDRRVVQLIANYYKNVTVE